MPKRFIFRFTYYTNLQRYMRDGEIRSNAHQNLQEGYQISHSGIVERRSDYKSPCEKSINSFVPFYFSPITAMTYAVFNGSVDLRGATGNCLGKASFSDIAFVVLSADKVIE